MFNPQAHSSLHRPTELPTNSTEHLPKAPPTKRRGTASVECAGKINPMHGGLTSQFTGRKGSADKIFVPDTKIRAIALGAWLYIPFGSRSGWCLVQLLSLHHAP